MIPERILTVVTRAHEPFYRRVLVDNPGKNLVVQPESRGTGAAILYALLRLCKLRPNLAVAVLPSDHFVSDNAEFMRQVDVAFDAIRDDPEVIVILGIRPESAETGYGSIEPGERLGVLPGDLFQVRRFWEKPPAALAQELMLRGCLWNSFVMVASTSGLLRLYGAIFPHVFAKFHPPSAGARDAVRGAGNRKALLAPGANGFFQGLAGAKSGESRGAPD